MNTQWVEDQIAVAVNSWLQFVSLEELTEAWQEAQKRKEAKVQRDAARAKENRPIRPVVKV